MKQILLFLLTISPLFSFTQENKKTVELVNPEKIGVYDKDLLPASFHKKRREELRKLLPDSSVAVFFSSPIRNRSNDVDYEYHQDPNFYYLTGLKEPHSVVLIYKEEKLINGISTNEVIFVRERDLSKELWNGKRLGSEGVSRILGFESVIKTSKFEKTDIKIADLNYIYFIKDKNDTRNISSRYDLYDLKKQFIKKSSVKKGSYKLNRWMGTLREIKTKEELVLMRKAIDITCKAQIALMKKLNPKMAEFQTEALVEYHFKNEGAEHAGFPSIHGSGENSCILHYTSNRRPMKPGDLLVSDIGAEYHGYTADVTRTLPVDGKYSKEEAIIYNIVLEAQSAGIEKCMEGSSFWAPGQIANKIIAKRLKEIGVIKKLSDVKKYFPHGTSHYLGLDVHDIGNYGVLTNGQVITVEPGIYIPENSDCDKKWWDIGVRIEDDILITTGNPENLSDCVPRTIEEIEAIMKKQ